MAKVRILSDRVANQIAAGEVIERPAAVVKELLENALDAGATRVEVEFRHGGRSLMRIEDNGHGMSRDDALLALERHATSKIVEAADLDRLASYGFRGEALPSIASVSRFELQTREQGSDAGTEILVNGGKFVHVRDCGRPVGTRIEVTHLFNSVPARRKFLKTDQTEAAHIVQCVRLYALACPRTSFTLIEDGRTVFRSPECATLAERIAEIFGRQTADSLVPIDAAGEGMGLHGLIGRPGVGRSTRHEMIVFVNQRPVDSRTLNYALIESYHESLPKGRYPLAFVFFECDPASVDVNVHPAKREVRFRSEPQVRGFVIRAVLARLRELGTPAGGAVQITPAGGAVQIAPAGVAVHVLRLTFVVPAAVGIRRSRLKRERLTRPLRRPLRRTSARHPSRRASRSRSLPSSLPRLRPSKFVNQKSSFLRGASSPSPTAVMRSLRRRRGSCCSTVAPRTNASGSSASANNFAPGWCRANGCSCPCRSNSTPFRRRCCWTVSRFSTRTALRSVSSVAIFFGSKRCRRGWSRPTRSRFYVISSGRFVTGDYPTKTRTSPGKH